MKIDHIEAILREIENKKALILLVPGKNLYYLTQFNIKLSLERPFLCLIDVLANNMFLVASKLFEKEIDSSNFKKYYFYADFENPFIALEKVIYEHELATDYVDLYTEKTLPCYIYNNICSLLKIKNTFYIDTIINKRRIIKNNDEISNIMKAAYIVDETYKRICKESLLGKSEKEIAALIDYIMKSLGADGSSFETIVAISENAAQPHHVPNDRVVKNGDSIVLDFGAIYNNYCSDITRTVFIGEPEDEAKKIYFIVKEAQSEAIKTVVEGRTIKDIDVTARKIITDYGYGDYFIHRTGHGIGLDVHEEPYITAENENIIANGMVFTVEPGIYIENKIGVRIEDDILVKDMAYTLTKSTKDLTILN